MEAIKEYGGVPKTLMAAVARHAGKISEVGNEGEDGYWIYCRDGWWNPHLEASMIHEYTVAACIRQLSGLRPDPRPPEKR